MGRALSYRVPISRQVRVIASRLLRVTLLQCRHGSLISCSTELQSMEEHPLLFTVACWPGRGSTQLAFEERGFTIHKARQDRIIQFCGKQQSHLLYRYWDEIALETMQSLGQGAPDQRAFVIQPRYRSAFLDELFAARDFVEPPFRYLRGNCNGTVPWPCCNAPQCALLLPPTAGIVGDLAIAHVDDWHSRTFCKNHVHYI